ncbi:MAG TPA: 2-isopropylmalate synthase [Candidatus Dormibacteraeota bacterium]|nr:2-isopropylmalate synthase [Candidatus Dormibacteraeota bacterium]
MDTVHIFDTTLRDGEQSPGFSMNRGEKLRLAAQLEELGVDVIEAGFPIASTGDLEAVRDVARQTRRAQVAALARAAQIDIDAALRAIEPAARPRIHVFLATSDLHLQHKLRITREQALGQIDRMVRYTRERAPEVEFSAEDASRTDLEYLGDVMVVAADAGATVLNLPDTVGYTTPEEYGAMFRYVRERLGDRPVVLSAHCHNDLGLAVANSLAAVAAGARQVECTINGIGERAGNASLEEIVVALAVRGDRLGARTAISLDKIYSTSRLLSEITGVSVPPNKAVVGANAFAHEAGIHQDGILKNPLTYEIIPPEMLGIPARRLVIGKHSGRNALRTRLEELGCPLSGETLEAAYRQVIELADRDKDVTDRDMLRIAIQSKRAAHNQGAGPSETNQAATPGAA